MSYIWAADESKIVQKPMAPRAFNPGDTKSQMKTSPKKWVDIVKWLTFLKDIQNWT